MRVKKVISIIMVSLLIITAITGCSMKGDKTIKKTTDKNTAKGKYVDGNIKLPDGITPEEYISLTKNPDGGLELYIWHSGNYEKYTYVENKWQEVKADDLKKFSSSASSISFNVTDVFYGEDGNLYILGDDSKDYSNALYKHSKNGTYEKIDIKKFHEKYEGWTTPCRPNVIKVLKNGMIAAIYPLGEIEVYTPDGQSVVMNFNSDNNGKITVEGNSLYYTDENGNEIHKVDMETQKTETSYSIEKKLSDRAILEVDNGTIYLCDTSGIHLIKEGSTIWETIVDGNQSKLGMPQYSLGKFILGSQNNYYLVMKDDRGAIIDQYYYDKNVKSVPSQELSIYSLKESKTIRQAIASFQESHPDVKINYQVANTKENVTFEYGATKKDDLAAEKDYINALNTQLLAKKGEDILVLDGLPIDSYIEKGVLEDMGSIFNPMIQSGELMGNIAKNYSKDGKVYTMPVRFALPIIYGAADAVNSADSMNQLTSYMQKNKKIPLLAPSSYQSLAAWFLLAYYDQIVNDKNVIDKEAFRNYLENVKQLAVNIDASDDVDITSMNTENGSKLGYWLTGALGVNKKLFQTNMEEMVNINSYSVPIKAIKAWKGSYKVINNTYRANSLVGINRAGTHKELAKEFVQLLFSNDIQSLDLSDGFPINKAAIERWVQEDHNNRSYSIMSEDDRVIGNYPGVKDRKQIYENICTLKHPMVNDTTGVNMILEEVERYLKGDISDKQATDNVLSRINRYLSE